MKIPALILLFSISFLSFAQQRDIEEIRVLFYKASNDKKMAKTFLDQLNRVNTVENSTLYGYKGMAHMLLAKYAWNPYKKLEHFYMGKAILEEAIKEDRSNIELRFLRYSVQSNSPFFLINNSELEADKELIKKQWSTLKDKDLRRRIGQFMLASGDCTEAEKKLFKA